MVTQRTSEKKVKDKMPNTNIILATSLRHPTKNILIKQDYIE